MQESVIESHKRVYLKVRIILSARVNASAHVNPWQCPFKLISSSSTITVPNLVLLPKIPQFGHIFAPICLPVAIVAL